VQTTYATIAELPSCPPGGAPPTAQPCSPTLVDMPTWANYVVFDRSGYGYVSDLQSATIWRVPPGGGTARVWFQDARLDSYFGPNGLAIDPSGTKLYVAMTASFQPTSPGLGIIYTLPLVSSPRAADLHTFFTYPEPGAGPDGLAFGASRKLYVALAGTNQISVLDSNGTEALRFPDAAANAMQEIPYDAPASIAFDGAGSILVTNHSFFTADRNHWAVLRAYVNDTELPGR
jgi:sugar lactone lactonase YvrE